MHYLDKGKTMTGHYYATLIRSVSYELMKKRLHFEKKHSYLP